MILDQNCFFLEPDTFKNIQIELEKDYVDVLEINLYKVLDNNYMNLYKCKHYDSQCNFTKLKYNLDVNDIDINDELLTNKIFKVKYFKDIMKKFKIDEQIEFNDIYYNEIFSFIIDSTVHSFKTSTSINLYLNEIDVKKFKFNDFKSVETNLINQTINYIDFIFNNSKDSQQDKNKVLQKFLNVLIIIFNKFTNISDLSLKLLNKFLDCKYISKQNKTLLNFYYSLLVN